MNPTIEFWVPGDPIPQGSKKAFQHKTTQRVVMLDNSPKVKPWRVRIAAAAQAAAPHVLTAERPLFAKQVPVVASLTFYLPRPATVKLTARRYPTVKPDVDKLARAAMDALTIAHVLHDDAQVVDMPTAKRYADGSRVPGIRLSLYVLD